MYIVAIIVSFVVMTLTATHDSRFKSAAYRKVQSHVLTLSLVAAAASIGASAVHYF